MEINRTPALPRWAGGGMAVVFHIITAATSRLDLMEEDPGVEVDLEDHRVQRIHAKMTQAIRSGMPAG